MRYEVIITRTAELEVEDAFAYIYARNPLNAERWLRQLYKSIDGLAEFRGYARARETDWLGAELYQKAFKSHRIVFSVEKKSKRAYVHFVRHGAQRATGEPDDLE